MNYHSPAPHYAPGHASFDDHAREKLKASLRKNGIGIRNPETLDLLLKEIYG
ncbi:MAG: hypothetical protein V4691_08625 [Pseudomonadota bacterium]